MDRIPRLLDAARRGDVAALQQMLNEDPQILDRNNQFEAIEVVAEKTRQHENFRVLFNAKDKEGNTFWRPDQTRENKSNEFVKKGQLENAMLVVAALIVTVTYQGCLSPPPTIWKAE
ncbi:hypothetical protein L6164_029214 [Bauhinia variegata]|uniref:Uncharacterized protein n=1 Tax=Bauhinia variegata TaxID=167791 RepID=A0ACB9L8Z1_BAUVA|nr:hypothetical protein L6164_029214 [Bauhinia variegata]